MTDKATTDQELDDWRDLLHSGGWARMLAAFEVQWGDKSVIQTLETLVVHQHANMAEETSALLKLRTAMRAFLAHPAQRVLELERQRDQAARAEAKPWTRAV